MSSIFNQKAISLAAVSLLGAACVFAAGSDDGQRQDKLLFMSNRDGNVFELYQMTADGSQPKRVLADRGEVSSSNWSPDGSRVLYSAVRGGRFDNIFQTTLADGDTKQLTNDNLPNSDPVWSPDGQSIAFVSMRDNGKRKIYLMDSDGRNQRRLTKSSDEDEISPRFSPDGKQLAYLAGGQEFPPRVAVAELHSREYRVLNPKPGRGIETPPVWSPDSKRLLFSFIKDEMSHVFTVTADGSERTQLTTGTGDRNSQAQWSPDGRKILFLSIRGDSARQGIFIMAADGAKQAKLFGEANDVMDARWSSDGQRIFFVEQLPTGGKVFSIDLTGRDIRRLSGNEGFDFNIQVCCSWQPRNLASR